MTLKKVSTIVALALSVLLFTSCAAEPAPSPAPSDAAEPSSTPSETPSVDPLTTVDSIELNAENFTLRSGTTDIATLPLSDTSGTLATLTTVLGEPTVTVTTPDPVHYCTLPNTSYKWGSGLSILTWTSGKPAGFDVRLLSPDVPSATNSSLTLSATGGVKVGDDISAQLAQAPDTMKQSSTYEGSTSSVLILQRGYPDQKFVTGVAAFTDDGIVKAIGTPIPVHSNQDC